MTLVMMIVMMVMMVMMIMMMMMMMVMMMVRKMMMMRAALAGSLLWQAGFSFDAGQPGRQPKIAAGCQACA